MKTFLVIMNVVAFLVSFGAILWAWRILRSDTRSNDALLTRLRSIDAKYEGSATAGPGQRKTSDQKFDEYRAAGKKIFTYNDMQHAPEMVEALINERAARGIGLQVWLVGAGLLIGTVANIIGLVA
ncbi:hypothetical protein AB4Y80_06480 [Specibacter sp. RAF43]